MNTIMLISENHLLVANHSGEEARKGQDRF
jgi:hypothetical protein